MKLSLLSLLVGCAMASVCKVLDAAAEQIYQDFMNEIEETKSLAEVLGHEEHDFFFDEAKEDIKTEHGKKLRETLDYFLEKEAVDPRKIADENLQKKMTVRLLDFLNKKDDKWKQKDLELIEKIFGKKEGKRSLKDRWENVKEYFKDLGIKLKEKYLKFGEWVKKVIDKSLRKSNIELENIRNIARELIDHSSNIDKETAVEALEFLRPYKEPLGTLWEEVEERIKDIVNRSD